MRLRFFKSAVHDAGAHEAATSPHNDLRHPSHEQIKAGNYRKGTIRWQGLVIRIENPTGSVRAGVDKVSGKVWLSQLRGCHYGYIRDIDGQAAPKGKDADHVDVFVGPDLGSDRVFIIDQPKADGSFDEHKVVIGVGTLEEARELYAKQYSPGWKVGPISELSVDEFKAWLRRGDTTLPFAKAEASTNEPRGDADDAGEWHVSHCHDCGRYSVAPGDHPGRHTHCPGCSGMARHAAGPFMGSDDGEAWIHRRIDGHPLSKAEVFFGWLRKAMGQPRSIKRPGSRGGVYYVSRAGHVVYGTRKVHHEQPTWRLLGKDEARPKGAVIARHKETGHTYVRVPPKSEVQAQKKAAPAKLERPTPTPAARAASHQRPRPQPAAPPAAQKEPTFLESVGMTWERVKALDAAGRAKLNAQFAEWKAKQGGAGVTDTKPDAKPEPSPKTSAEASPKADEPKEAQEAKEKGYGHTGSAFAPESGAVINFRYRVVSLGDLKVNDSEVQPRARTRAASMEQIASIAGKFNPHRFLAGNTELDRGLPIVGNDLKVESGNGRISAVRQMAEHHPHKLQHLDSVQREQAAKFGLTGEDFEGIKDPVIVRERTTTTAELAQIYGVNEPDARKRFADDANARATLAVSPAEQATSDAKRISASSIEALEVGDSQTIDQALGSGRNAEVVQTFLKDLPANDRNAMVTANGSKLTPLGIQRLKSAILAHVFPGQEGQSLVTAATESSDSNVKNVETGIFGSIAPLAKVKVAIEKDTMPPGLDISEDIPTVVHTLSRIRMTGALVDDYVKQESMFDSTGLSAFQKRLLVKFAGAKSAKQVRELLRTYCQIALELPPPAQGSMFAAPTPTKDKVFDKAEKAIEAEREEATPSMFGKARLFLSARERSRLEQKFDLVSLNRLLLKCGIARDYRELTNSQAGFLLTFKDVDSIRNRIVAEGWAREVGAPAGASPVESRRQTATPSEAPPGLKKSRLRLYFKSQLSLFGSKPREEVRAPGSRGGRFYIDRYGKIQYGERPAPAARTSGGLPIHTDVHPSLDAFHAEHPQAWKAKDHLEAAKHLIEQPGPHHQALAQAHMQAADQKMGSGKVDREKADRDLQHSWLAGFREHSGAEKESPKAASKPAPKPEAAPQPKPEHRTAAEQTPPAPKPEPKPARLDVKRPAASEPKEKPIGGAEDYAYKDVGYVAGSRKELAQQAIRAAGREGRQVSWQDVDWKALEENPRAAEALIVKSNVFGDVDWKALQSSGMEPGAAYLLRAVYASVGVSPDEADLIRRQSSQGRDEGSMYSLKREGGGKSETVSPKSREDYVRGINTLRERLERCRSVADVVRTLEEIKGERDGSRLSVEEADRYQKLTRELTELHATKHAYSQASDPIVANASRLDTERRRAEYQQQSRVSRGWKPDPELTKKIEELRVEARKEWDAAIAAGEPEDAKKEREAKVGELSRERIQVLAGARKRNLAEDPLTRAWHVLGIRFAAVLSFRSGAGSDAFGKSVAAAKAGKITDWSWADAEPKKRGDSTEQSTRFQLLVADSYSRKGGKNVAIGTSTDLKDKFNLRAVQSGNWVLDDLNSGKFHMEQCAAAFSDLADVVGIAPHEVSLKGRLAMAFGARGVGGAKAHYEPIDRVINITKMNGAGSLAHEWFHAVDNILMAAYGVDSRDAWATHGGPNNSKLPPRVHDAFAALRNAIHSGSHRRRETVRVTSADDRLAAANIGSGQSGGWRSVITNAKSLDDAMDGLRAMHATHPQGFGKGKRGERQFEAVKRIAIAWHTRGEMGNERNVEVAIRGAQSQFVSDAMDLESKTAAAGGKLYWSSGHELAARAFAAYVYDRLADADRKNEYLSYKAENRFYMAGRPYPEGEERQRINSAFDKLFEALREEKSFAKATAMGRRLVFRRLNAA